MGTVPLRVNGHLFDAAKSVGAVASRINVSTAIRDTAALFEPAKVHSLDAIHLAIALVLGDDPDAVVTYDLRMADAATSLGLHVIALA